MSDNGENGVSKKIPKDIQCNPIKSNVKIVKNTSLLSLEVQKKKKTAKF